MRRIELYRNATCWMARFVGDPEILRLFGTTDIPTPYTPQAPAASVLAQTQARNPGMFVCLAQVHEQAAIRSTFEGGTVRP